MLAGAIGLGLMAAGCAGSSPASSQTKGVTITVAWATPGPPAAALAQFTKSTGIHVKWTNIDWDSLQTKISAAANGMFSGVEVTPFAFTCFRSAVYWAIVVGIVVMPAFLNIALFTVVTM